MSSTISTLAARRFEARRPFHGRCWRLVEAQHVVSTAGLVHPTRQARLEELIDGTKPELPAECRGLDYLLQAPFRYTPRQGSRWRRARQLEGAFYAAAEPRTAAAEMAFHRLLFFAESPRTPFSQSFAEYTAIEVAIASLALVDLVAAPVPATADLVDYTASQAFADAVRALGAEGIAQVSVRCPHGGSCLTWFTCRAFAQPAPTSRATWRMRIDRHGISFICENPRERLFFDRGAFAPDPRLADFDWNR